MARAWFAASATRAPTGWYIWTGELQGDDEFFAPLHVEHVAARCPAAERYLALPPGWTFLVAPGQPIIAHRNTDNGSGLGTRRWVVERTFVWLHFFRRLRLRWERRPELHQAFMALGCAIICQRYLRQHTSAASAGTMPV